MILKSSDVLDLPNSNNSIPWVTVISPRSRTKAKILCCASTVFSFKSGFSVRFFHPILSSDFFVRLLPIKDDLHEHSRFDDVRFFQPSLQAKAGQYMNPLPPLFNQLRFLENTDDNFIAYFRTPIWSRY